MQTGQNSSVPENSLPQLGQVRWGGVLMGPKRPSSGILAEGNSLRGEVRNRPARPLANYCPVPQAIACSCILARQSTFRNKIPTARVLRRPPVDIESFIQALLSGF